MNDIYHQIHQVRESDELQQAMLEWLTDRCKQIRYTRVGSIRWCENYNTTILFDNPWQMLEVFLTHGTSPINILIFFRKILTELPKKGDMTNHVSGHAQVVWNRYEELIRGLGQEHPDILDI